MPWKGNTTMSLRHEFVRLATQPNANISALARRFAISRKTAYKWIQRYREEGSRKIRRWLLDRINEGNHHLRADDVPAVSTCAAILKRRGWIDDEEAPKHRPYQRFEREAPNELWQMDFKGDFPLTGGGRYCPLTVLDDHSRFALALEACSNQQKETVKARLTTILRRYGLSEAIQRAFCQRDRIPRLSCAFLPGKDDDARKPLAVAG